ncbi:MAG: tandem-95 repeat protein, partial [Gemmatimonadetes bacterium]|nr:tandem-95 repeat protein [Gemmatimonadota bacterium]
MTNWPEVRAQDGSGIVNDRAADSLLHRTAFVLATASLATVLLTETDSPAKSVLLASAFSPGLKTTGKSHSPEERSTRSAGSAEKTLPGDIEARDDNVSTFEDTPLEFDVLANDSDSEGQPLAIIFHSAPARGRLSCVTSGRCTYTPLADASGQESFYYLVGNLDGNLNRAEVSIRVIPVNDPPRVVDDVATTLEEVPVTTSVLANDTDVEGDALTVVGWENGEKGEVACSTVICTYTPARDFFGSDSFTYTVADGRGGSSTGTVRVQVENLQDAPNAMIDAPPPPGTTVVQAGESVRFAGTATDPDGNGTIVSFTWDFGGGAPPSAVEDPGPVAFPTPGLFTVTFDVRDQMGAGDPTPDRRQIQVLAAPPPPPPPP